MEVVQERYLNEVILPLNQFLKQMSAFPVCTQPDSNVYMHQFVGLVLAVNHFFERYDNKERKVSDVFRQISNSVKHIPDRGHIYKPELLVLYEFENENFRFVKNTIIDANDSNEPKLDLIAELLNEVNNQSRDLNLMMPRLMAHESVYGFYPWAFAYHDPSIAVSTKSTRFQVVTKREGSYVPVAPENVRFVVFGHDMVGHDPTYAFPNV